jgi:dTDP-4-dehydrorhamnose 3,5-epimerase
VEFISTPLQDLYVINLAPRLDERGHFVRSYCMKELAKIGVSDRVSQINRSFSIRQHTLRGMHFQVQPHSEVKVVSCLRGSLVDVVIDLRENSASFGKSFSIVLSENSNKQLVVPKGFAHGFMTLSPNTEMEYFVTAEYSPASERSLVWNDSRLVESWPASPEIISMKDQNALSFDQAVKEYRDSLKQAT